MGAHLNSQNANRDRIQSEQRSHFQRFRKSRLPSGSRGGRHIRKGKKNDEIITAVAIDGAPVGLHLHGFQGRND